MEINEDELKYSQVIRSLKRLSKVKAPENFETDLMRRINSASFKEEKENFWDRILIPSKIIPSAALAVTAVILFFVINVESEEFENPLLINPRIRENVTTTSTQIVQIPIVLKSEEKIIEKEKIKSEVKKEREKPEYYTNDIIIPEPKGTDKKSSIKILPPEPLGYVRLDSINPLENINWMQNDSFFTENIEVSGNYPTVTSSTGQVYQISKSGLNFRQVNIVEEERQQIIRLREKIKSLMNETGKALKMK
jgi:hypothetical protein